MPSRPPIDALRGSLDLLVLKTLSLSPTHGWGISQRVQQISGGEFEMNQGSLYPALQRLEKEGLITSDWGVTDNNRQARYYRLTAAGRRALGNEVERWKRFASKARRLKACGLIPTKFAPRRKPRQKAPGRARRAPAQRPPMDHNLNC